MSWPRILLALDQVRIDPAQRVALELSWEAWDGSGMGARRAARARASDAACGVFLSVGSLPHYLTDVMGADIGSMRAHEPALYFDLECGQDKDYAATRVAYHLDLAGPARLLTSPTRPILLHSHRSSALHPLFQRVLYQPFEKCEI